MLRLAFPLLPLLFYGLTASRTPGWADAPLIAGAVANLELSAWVNSHNLFIVVGHLALRLLGPWLGPWYAMNLLSAAFGALTVVVVFRIGLRLTDNALASALGAVALMLSHSLWWHSTMLEVYTLNTLLIALMVLFVLRYDQQGSLRDLCLAALCFGLGCSNHALMGLFGAGFLGLLVLPEQRRRLLKSKPLLLLGASFLLGFLLYLGVFVAEMIQRAGSDVTVARLGAVLGIMFDETTGGGFRQYMFPEGLTTGERFYWIAFYVGLLFYSLPPPVLLLGVAGAVALLRRRELAATLTFFAVSLMVQLIWSSNYLVWDMYAFALPVYVLFGMLVGPGFDWAQRGSRPLRLAAYAAIPLLFVPPFVYRMAPARIGSSESALGMLARLPQWEQAAAFWDPLTYFFDPNKRSYDRVERYARRVLEQLEPGAFYWGDEAKLVYPLKYYYQDVLGERPDVEFEVIFGMLPDQAEFQSHAMQMRAQLDRGRTVYIPSLGYPERDVLNLLYRSLRPEVSLSEIRELEESRFIDSFPGVRFEEVPIDEPDGILIYRLTTHQPPAEGSDE